MNTTSTKQIKTLCSNISYEQSKYLYKNCRNIIVEELESKKQIHALIVDHSADDQKGFIVRFKKNDVKGMIRKYQMGEAEPLGSSHLFPKPPLKDYVECDLRDIHNGKNFYLVHDEKTFQSSIYFSKISFDQIKPDSYILVLSTRNPLKITQYHGLDYVIEANPSLYKYKPISDWSKVFDCHKHNAEHFFIYQVHNIDHEKAEKFVKSLISNVNILAQYYETFEDLFSVPKNDVYNIIFDHLSSPASYISFMTLFNTYVKSINNIYYNQEQPEERVKVLSAFKHIFNLQGVCV